MTIKRFVSILICVMMLLVMGASAAVAEDTIKGRSHCPDDRRNRSVRYGCSQRR